MKKYPGLIILLCFLAAGCGTLSGIRHHDPALGERIAAIAKQYKGAPYRYGGTTPQGFDCSGFTSYAARKAGIDIPRTSGAQFRAGRRVSPSNLEKGDLVFFTRYPLIGKLFPPSHVGIYVGNGRFIHAPSSGGRVRHDALNAVYYKNRLKGARRLG